MRSDGHDDAQVQRLASLARSAVAERLRLAHDAGAPARLVQAARAGAGGRSPRLWAGGLLLVGAAAALLVVAAGRGRPPSPVQVLSYAVERVPAPAPPAQGRQPAGVPSDSMRLHFSDGTTIATADETSLRVESTARQAPRVRVGAQIARVRVVHRPDTQWTFLAGPFEVLVTGTAFNLGWDPAAQALSLDLLEGAVILRGPRLPGGSLAVRAGQRVSLSLSTGAFSVREHSTGATTSAPPIPSAEESPGPAVSPPATGAKVSSARREAGESWSEMVGKGEFGRVIAAAHRRSIDDCQKRCTAAELRALGDAARYSNHPTLAARSFQSLRGRFPGSTDATIAAYLLGRTYEAKGQWRDAEALYAAYLNEAPAGAFAIEAASGRARAQARRQARDGRPPDGAP